MALSPYSDRLVFFLRKFQTRQIIITLQFIPKSVAFVIFILFHNQILAFLYFILNAFIKSSSISSTGLPLSRNNNRASSKHLISNRHSNSDNSKNRFCSFIAKTSFASTLYRKRGLVKNVRLTLNMIVRPGIVIKFLMNIRTISSVLNQPESWMRTLDFFAYICISLICMSRDYPALFIMPVKHSGHTLRQHPCGFLRGNCAVLQDSAVPDTLQTYSVSLSSACGFCRCP